MPSAPKQAPTQTIKETGKGTVPKGKQGHPAQPTLAPKPPSAGTTGPKGSQSVDYDHNQGNRVGGNPSISEQQQQDKKRR